MDIIFSEFYLGENKINLAKKYQNIERLTEKTGIESVWATNGDIMTLAQNAFRNSDKSLKNKIKIFILVTQSPLDFLPANSTTIAHKLGLGNEIFTFDFNQGCSGFVQAFLVMRNLIKRFNTGLIITADCYRKKLDPLDRSTNAVFSDAASAIIFKQNKDKNILFQETYTDGSKRNWLYQSTKDENNGFLHMSGSEIWIFTLRKVVPQIENAIKYCKEKKMRIGAIYIHQASKIVVDGIKSALGKYGDLILENYKHYGNTVSSTIPILICEQPIEDQDGVVILSGFGVGLTSTTIVYG